MDDVGWVIAIKAEEKVFAPCLGVVECMTVELGGLCDKATLWGGDQ